jgi:c-di-GMP-binding flagellar brake protein YcgR
MMLGLLQFGTVLLALTAVERFRAASETPSPWNGWQWLALILGGVLVIVIAASISHRRKRRQQEEADWEAFYREAHDRNLSTQEVDMLKIIARQSGIRHPDAIFGMDTAFHHGTHEFRHSSSYEQMSSAERKDFDKTLAVIRGKLADSNHISGDDDSQTDSRSIQVGTRLSVLHSSLPEGCSSTVTQCDAKHLGVRPDTPLILAPGEECRIRYFDGRTVWEFDTSVQALGAEEGEILLAHSDQLRFIDRRRFHRVPVQRRAIIAPYNFHIDDETLRAPEFTDSLVIEMAGPGMKLRTPLELSKGDHILIVVQYKDKRSFQGIARVVRVDDPRRMIKSVGVEMLGLSPREISQMTTVTNAAAIQQRKDDQRQQSPDAVVETADTGSEVSS